MRLFALSTGAAFALLAVLAPSAFADFFSPESGAGSGNADAIDTLYWFILVLGFLVFVGVEGVLFYSLYKFRAGKGRVAAQIHGNTQLEIGWTIGAAVILVFITAITFIKLGDIRNPEKTGDPNGPKATAGLAVPVVQEVKGDRDQPKPPGGKSLHINVDGQQYVWRFQYPSDLPNLKGTVFSYEEMVVPVNTTVTMDVTADDVAHSWWVPALGGKYDALPGYVNKGWFKATKVGVYRGQCAELCGRNHANMLARVRVVPVDEFKQWFTAKANEIATARKDAAASRAQLDKQQAAGASDQNP